MSLDLTVLTWIFIFSGSILVCFRNTLRMGWLVLLIAYALALITRQMNFIGIAMLGITAAALYATTRARGWWQVPAHLAFLTLSILLFLHKLPGFNNLLIFDHVLISQGAVPFTMYLNLDKPFIGFILFSLWYASKPSIQSIVLPLLATSIICLGTAFVLNFIAWNPKLPPLGWLWAINNLLLVAMCEEALFRGYLQHLILDKQLFKGKHPYLALVIAAVLFGVAHFAGGPSLILLATIAGCGYGWAYCKGGILASVFTHFAFNALHFFLFTYPALTFSS